MHPHIQFSIICNSQDMEATQVPINRMHKKSSSTYINTQPEKKNKILPYATVWMDTEGIMVSKISQTEKDRHKKVSFIWGI